MRQKQDYEPWTLCTFTAHFLFFFRLRVASFDYCVLHQLVHDQLGNQLLWFADRQRILSANSIGQETQNLETPNLLTNGNSKLSDILRPKIHPIQNLVVKPGCNIAPGPFRVHPGQATNEN